MKSSAIYEQVKRILEDVRKRGDRALVEYSWRLDRTRIRPKGFLVSKSEIRKAVSEVSSPLKAALKMAARNIEHYQRRLLPRPWQEERDGLIIGERYIPVEKAGIYIPGGRHSYPSSVLMCALPAKVAGVKKVIMVTPPSNIVPQVLYAAHIAGVDRIYRIGGAQAIAALAYGTRTIPRTDLIIGPGNIYVTLAKQMVFGKAGIDMLAGPSEVMILADDSASLSFVLKDLKAQAEHDPLARATLLLTSRRLYARVVPELRGKRQFSIMKVRSQEEAVRIINQKAPEHLELMVKRPGEILKKITNAGAIFLGHHTPVALGDYWAGPSHVLPTGGSARFSSGLSSLTFLRRVSIVQCRKEKLRKVGRHIMVLSKAEGMNEHAESVRVRLDNKQRGR